MWSAWSVNISSHLGANKQMLVGVYLDKGRVSDNQKPGFQKPHRDTLNMYITEQTTHVSSNSWIFKVTSGAPISLKKGHVLSEQVLPGRKHSALSHAALRPGLFPLTPYFCCISLEFIEYHLHETKVNQQSYSDKIALELYCHYLTTDNFPW